MAVGESNLDALPASLLGQVVEHGALCVKPVVTTVIFPSLRARRQKLWGGFGVISLQGLRCF